MGIAPPHPLPSILFLPRLHVGVDGALPRRLALSARPVLKGLSALSAVCLAIAALPEQIRGYGPVKERAIAKARQQEKLLREQFGRGDEVQSVRLFEPVA